MDKETAIKSIEKGIRIAEAAESGWVWITIEQARNAVDLINYQHEHIEAFLAEQKPVDVEYKRIDDDYQAIEDEFTCKRCGAWWMIPKEDLRYCPKCGRAVKWNDND